MLVEEREVDKRDKGDLKGVSSGRESGREMERRIDAVNVGGKKRKEKGMKTFNKHTRSQRWMEGRIERCTFQQPPPRNPVQ